MAKHNGREHEHEHNHEEAAPASTIAPAPAAAIPAPDERYVKFVCDEEGSIFAFGDISKVGHTVNRIDFIRNAWTVTRQARGAIAKQLTRLTGKEVKYQIVFSATRNLVGGPAPAAPAPSASAAPAEQPAA